MTLILDELTFFVMCVLQPICLPIPETVTILVGSNLIGGTKAVVYGVIGSLLGITIMYSICSATNRYLKRFVQDGKKLEKYIEYTKHHEILITGLLFVIPLLPDEMICLGAGMIGISYSKLIVVAFFAKVISIGMIGYADPIASIFGVGKGKIVVIELVIVFVISIIFERHSRKNTNNTDNRGNAKSGGDRLEEVAR